MAKRAKKTSKKNVNSIPDNVLPQNIVSFGEHVVADKNIYISQDAYKEIHKFTKDKTENESGGVLIGNVIEEFGKTNIIVRGFVEAKYSEGTPTTLKFTHETWDYIHGEVDKKYQNYKILGWIHTHPDFGIFLSEYDKFIQENFFKEENQIAYVVDPIQHIEGFYFWINGKIERCKGFFVFDNIGEEITVSDKEDDEPVAVAAPLSNVWKIATSVLGAAVVILLVVCLSLNGKVKNLQTQMGALVESANQSLSYMSMQINSLYGEIDNLTAKVKALEPEDETPEESSPEAQEESSEESSSDPEETPELDNQDNTQESQANTDSSLDGGGEETDDNE